MGWTGTSLRDGETVRDLLITAVEGDPEGCGACGWYAKDHPRVIGSEYDAIYGPSPERPKDPHDYVPRVQRWRVLDYARVAFGTVYMAAEDIETGEVSGLVFLVHSGRNGEVTYKDMSEDMGPGCYDCPERILDRLSPTKSEWANEWRAGCRETLARRKSVKSGCLIRFAQPLEFTNGERLTDLRYVKGSQFTSPEGWGRYSVSGWRSRDFTVEEAR